MKECSVSVWEQRKLGDFGKATGGTSIESEFSEDGIYKVISIGSYSENSVYNDQGIRAIKSDKTSNRILNRNDLTMILNDKTTSGNIIGRVLLIEESGIYVYNQRTERIEINLDEYDPVFLYEMLNAPNIREKIIKQAQGNTQIYVNWTAISLLEYMIPSKEEQVKIGEYLHSISNLITLHQRKRLGLLKVGKNAWEQRKLGDDIVNIHTGTNLIGSESNSGLPLIKMGNIQRGYFDTSKLEYLAENEYPEKEDIANYGDFFFNTRNTLELVGKGATWMGTSGEYAFNSNIARFEFKNIDTIFLNYLYNTEDMTRQIHARAMGTTSVAAIYPRNLESVEYYVPIMEEQQMIGSYFQSIDRLITLHQQKQN